MYTRSCYSVTLWSFNCKQQFSLVEFEGNNKHSRILESSEHDVRIYNFTNLKSSLTASYSKPPMPKPPPSFASGPSVFELEEVAEVKLNTWCKAGCGPGSWPASTTSTTAGEVVAGNQPPQRIPRASVFTSLISEAVVSCDMETQAWSNYLNSEFLTIYLRCSLSSACSLPLFAVFSCSSSLSLFPPFLFISLSLFSPRDAWARGCMSIKSNKIKYMLQSLTVRCSAPSNACNFSMCQMRWVVGYLQGLTGSIAPKNGCCWWMESNYGCASWKVQQS